MRSCHSRCTGAGWEQLVWEQRAHSHPRPLLMSPLSPGGQTAGEGVYRPRSPLALVLAFTDLATLPAPRHILSGEAPVASTFCPAKWESRSLGAGKFWKTEKFWPCCYSQLGSACLSNQVDAHKLGDDCWAAPISSCPPPPPNCLTHVGKAQLITTSSSPICRI